MCLEANLLNVDEDAKFLTHFVDLPDQLRLRPPIDCSRLQTAEHTEPIPEAITHLFLECSFARGTFALNEKVTFSEYCTGSTSTDCFGTALSNCAFKAGNILLLLPGHQCHNYQDAFQ